MRKLLTLGAILAVIVVGCESKTPTGPGTVTVQQLTTTTTPVTTTVPGGGGGGTPTTVPPTTTIPLSNVTRRFVGSSTQPTVPNDMTLFFQLLFATTGRLADPGEQPALNTTMATYAVTGVYRTANGGGGIVKGELAGEIDGGGFSGLLVFDAAGCTAEREYTGVITAASLALSGGRLLRDCKDSPLAWSSVTLVRSDAPPPATTTTPTTTPAGCTYDLNPTSATVSTAGGVGEVTVTTQPGCGWSAQSFVSWVTVQPPAASGNGRAQYTVQSGPQRTATLLIAGKPFILTQSPSASSTTTSTTSSSTSTTTSGPTSSTTTSPTSSTTSSSSTSTSTSTSTSSSTSTTTSVLPPGFAATVYPNMIAGGVATPCSNCHPTATSAAAFTWATGGVISNPPAATAPFTTRPSQTGISHTGGTLWPNGGGSYTAAVAWITGGRQP